MKKLPLLLEFIESVPQGHVTDTGDYSGEKMIIQEKPRREDTSIARRKWLRENTVNSSPSSVLRISNVLTSEINLDVPVYRVI